MYCRKCGQENDDNAFRCTKCGEALQQVGPDQQQPTEFVPNYLVQAILVTFFCAWPFGIPAIVNAVKVNSKLRAGDHAGAVEASNRAKMWCWISFGIGLGIVVIMFIVIVIATILEGAQ